MPTSKLEPAPPYKESSTVVSTRVARNANENTATMVTEKGDVFLAKYDYPTIKNKTKKELMLSIPERIATSSELPSLDADDYALLGEMAGFAPVEGISQRIDFDYDTLDTFSSPTSTQLPSAASSIHPASHTIPEELVQVPSICDLASYLNIPLPLSSSSTSSVIYSDPAISLLETAFDSIEQLADLIDPLSKAKDSSSSLVQYLEKISTLQHDLDKNTKSLLDETASLQRQLTVTHTSSKRLKAHLQYLELATSTEDALIAFQKVPFKGAERVPAIIIHALVTNNLNKDENQSTSFLKDHTIGSAYITRSVDIERCEIGEIANSIYVSGLTSLVPSAFGISPVEWCGGSTTRMRGENDKSIDIYKDFMSDSTSPKHCLCCQYFSPVALISSEKYKQEKNHYLNSEKISSSLLYSSHLSVQLLQSYLHPTSIQLKTSTQFQERLFHALDLPLPSSSLSSHVSIPDSITALALSSESGLLCPPLGDVFISAPFVVDIVSAYAQQTLLSVASPISSLNTEAVSRKDKIEDYSIHNISLTQLGAVGRHAVSLQRSCDSISFELVAITLDRLSSSLAFLTGDIPEQIRALINKMENIQSQQRLFRSSSHHEAGVPSQFDTVKANDASTPVSMFTSSKSLTGCYQSPADHASVCDVLKLFSTLSPLCTVPAQKAISKVNSNIALSLLSLWNRATSLPLPASSSQSTSGSIPQSVSDISRNDKDKDKGKDMESFGITPVDCMYRNLYFHGIIECANVYFHARGGVLRETVKSITPAVVSFLSTNANKKNSMTEGDDTLGVAETTASFIEWFSSTLLGIFEGEVESLLALFPFLEDTVDNVDNNIDNVNVGNTDTISCAIDHVQRASKKDIKDSLETSPRDGIATCISHSNSRNISDSEEFSRFPNTTLLDLVDIDLEDGNERKKEEINFDVEGNTSTQDSIPLSLLTHVSGLEVNSKIEQTPLPMIDVGLNLDILHAFAPHSHPVQGKKVESSSVSDSNSRDLTSVSLSLRYHQEHLDRAAKALEQGAKSAADAFAYYGKSCNNTGNLMANDSPSLESPIGEDWGILSPWIFSSTERTKGPVTSPTELIRVTKGVVKRRILAVQLSIFFHAIIGAFSPLAVALGTAAASDLGAAVSLLDACLGSRAGVIKLCLVSEKYPLHALAAFPISRLLDALASHTRTQLSAMLLRFAERKVAHFAMQIHAVDSNTGGRNEFNTLTSLSSRIKTNLMNDPSLEFPGSFITSLSIIIDLDQGKESFHHSLTTHPHIYSKAYPSLLLSDTYTLPCVKNSAVALGKASRSLDSSRLKVVRGAFAQALIDALVTAGNEVAERCWAKEAAMEEKIRVMVVRKPTEVVLTDTNSSNPRPPPFPSDVHDGMTVDAVGTLFPSDFLTLLYGFHQSHSQIHWILGSALSISPALHALFVFLRHSLLLMDPLGCTEELQREITICTEKLTYSTDSLYGKLSKASFTLTHQRIQRLNLNSVSLPSSETQSGYGYGFGIGLGFVSGLVGTVVSRFTGKEPLTFSIKRTNELIKEQENYPTEEPVVIVRGSEISPLTFTEQHEDKSSASSFSPLIQSQRQSEKKIALFIDEVLSKHRETFEGLLSIVISPISDVLSVVGRWKELREGQGGLAARSKSISISAIDTGERTGKHTLPNKALLASGLQEMISQVVIEATPMRRAYRPTSSYDDVSNISPKVSYSYMKKPRIQIQLEEIIFFVNLYGLGLGLDKFNEHQNTMNNSILRLFSPISLGSILLKPLQNILFQICTDLKEFVLDTMPKDSQEQNIILGQLQTFQSIVKSTLKQA